MSVYDDWEQAKEPADKDHPLGRVVAGIHRESRLRIAGDAMRDRLREAEAALQGARRVALEEAARRLAADAYPFAASAVFAMAEEAAPVGELSERLAAETGDAAPAGWQKNHSGWTLHREGEAEDLRCGLAEGLGEPVLLAHVQRPDVDWANGKGWYWYVQDPDRKAKDWPSGHERQAWDAIAAAEEVVKQLGLEPIR